MSDDGRDSDVTDKTTSETQQPQNEEEKKANEEEIPSSKVTTEESESISDENTENSANESSHLPDQPSIPLPKRKRTSNPLEKDENDDSTSQEPVFDLIYPKKMKISEAKDSIPDSNSNPLPSSTEEMETEPSEHSEPLPTPKKLLFPTGNPSENPVLVEGDVWSHLFAIGRAFHSLQSKSSTNSNSSKSVLEVPKVKPVLGHLISMSGQPDIVINSEDFVVGKSPRSNIVLKDAMFPNHLFRIFSENSNLYLESLSAVNTPFVYHNHSMLKKGTKMELKNGDQLTINGARKLLYNVRIANPNSTNSLKLLENPRSRLSFPLKKDFLDSDKSKENEKEKENETEKVEEPPKKLTKEALKTKLKEFFKKEFFPEETPMEEKQKTTFENFPYFISENTKQILIHTAFMHLSKQNYMKYVPEIPLSKRILLQGPVGSDIYQLKLVEALANHFNAALITLDQETILRSLQSIFPTELPKEDDEIEEFDPWNSKLEPQIATKSSKSSVKKSSSKERSSKTEEKEKTSKSESSSNNNNTEKAVGSVAPKLPFPAPRKPLEGLNVHKQDKLLSNYLLGGASSSFRNIFGDRKEAKEPELKHVPIQVEALFEVLEEDPRPKILFIKEVESVTMVNYEKYTAWKNAMEKLNSMIVIASLAGEPKINQNQARGIIFSKGGSTHLVSLLDHLERGSGSPSSSTSSEAIKESAKQSRNLPLNKLFPLKIHVLPPNAGPEMEKWNRLLKDDTEVLKRSKNAKAIQKVLEKNNVECDNLISIPSLSQGIISVHSIEKMVAWAISHQLMTQKEEENLVKNGKLVLTTKSIEYALNTLSDSEPDQKTKTLRNVECENDFEKRVLSEVIPPSELNLAFEDIGALDEVKQTLKELVMLPLQRPELFSKGSLTRPCKGILLFGPPGTGKTMLAKAVATQSGANFINVSMSTIASKWFGEGEKYVKAIFTLASKISPTVIFIDEVDSILGKREKNGEHEAMRKIKNEFMTYWDGLKTKEKERVLVLAATNRPFDLDEAVLRRLSRRILIDLPSLENRVKILKVILSKEELEPNVDFQQIAKLTEGFSGSDLKNLCVAAAYQPIREVLDKEKTKKSTENSSENQQQEPVVLRSLRMKDFEKSLNEISASVSEDTSSISELRKWNQMFGEGGNRQKPSLPYYL